MIKFIHKTVSLCNTCYRHIPANVYEESGNIMMDKVCPEHGHMTSVVETDPDFYYGLQHSEQLPYMVPSTVVFETTDKCNLNCPHCYHIPDNSSTDEPIETLISRVSKFPKDSKWVMAGAEPTVRKDFVEVCKRMHELNPQGFSVLTNGLKFSDRDFAQAAYDAGLLHLSFGLNHWTYQGKTVHDKQLAALSTAISIGYTIGYVGYTLESLDDVEDVLKEIAQIDNPQIHIYRIRCGSFIGRSSDSQRSYLSNLVKRVKGILGNAIQVGEFDNNPYHVTMHWGKIKLRLIQWPDVTNIDMEELNTGPWANFYEGPVTNFAHQVITRDAYINNNLPKLDRVPVKYECLSNVDKGDYNRPHWRDQWQGPVLISEFDWSIEGDMRPRSPTIIPITSY